MNNRFIYLMLAIMTGAIAYLYVKNFNMDKRLDSLSERVDEVKITPVNPATKAIDPSSLSPFDKSHTDPLADQFPPESSKMPELTTIKFDRMSHNFGKITEGDKVNTVFKFTNTGKNPLVITNAQGSCGCTVPKWPNHPIKVGGSEEIAVEFNSAGKHGETEKTVTVTANTNPPASVLAIKSTVIPRDK